MPRKIQKIHDAEKWIEDISKLADKASTKDNQEKLINLANTTKTLLNDTSIEYEDKSEAFTKALEKIQNIGIESSQIFLDPSETIDKSILQEPPKIIVEKIAGMRHTKKTKVELKSDKKLDATDARKWIEDVRNLAEENVNHEDKEKILKLADTAEKLINDDGDNYNQLIEDFVTAIEDVQDSLITSPLLSTSTGKDVYNFLTKNAWDLATISFKSMRGISDFRQTEKVRDRADLDNLAALPKEIRKKS